MAGTPPADDDQILEGKRS